MAKKSKFTTKIIAGIGASVAVVVIILFTPLTSLGFVDDTPFNEVLKETQEEAMAIGLEIPFCTDTVLCQDSYDVETRNLFDEIIDPVVEGLQTPDDDIILINGNETKVVEGIIETDPISNLTEQPKVEIISNITKTDNSGETFTISRTTDFPFAQLFVEDTSNRDFDQGFIETELFLKTIPVQNVNVDGLFDILIANETIFSSPIPIKVDGITDQNGLIRISFISPTGFESKNQLFQFNDNLDKFPEQGLTEIDYKITVTGTIEDFSYQLDSGTIFDMTIFTDLNLLLITDEDGGTIRVFPTDDQLRIDSSARNWSYKNGRGCSSRLGGTCGSYITVKTGVGAPAMGGGEVFIIKDGVEESIATFPANTKQGVKCTNRGCSGISVGKLNIDIQRDEIYKIVFTNPNGELMFKTPMVKTSYSFNCINLGGGGFPDNIFCNYNDPTTKDALLATLEQP